jgi:hypothetical protein
MVRQIKSLDDVPLDPVEAVKRGLIQRGLFPLRRRRNEQADSPEADDQEVSQSADEPEPGEVHEKLIDITEKAHDVLFEAETVFPFTPFPHTISLDREKLTIASRSFFRTARILTVPITSMISAEAHVGPFFGSVKMTSKYFVDNVHEVNFLWRDDATEIHRLLQGFIIAHEKKLDMSEIDKEDLRTLLHDLGQGVND